MVSLKTVLWQLFQKLRSGSSSPQRVSTFHFVSIDDMKSLYFLEVGSVYSLYFHQKGSVFESVLLTFQSVRIFISSGLGCTK